MKRAYQDSSFNIVAITGEILNYIWVIYDNDLTLVKNEISKAEKLIKNVCSPAFG